MDRDTKKWLGVIFGFIGLMAAFNALLLSAALSDRKSLEAIPGAYDQGLKWDQTQAMLVASEQLGWTVAIAAHPGSTPGVTLLTASVQDRQGAPVLLDKAHAVLTRPSDRHIERHVTLAAQAPGTYSAEVPLELAGKWYASLDLARQSERYVRRHELSVPGPGAEKEQQP